MLWKILGLMNVNTPPKYSLGYDDKKFFRSESLYHLGFYQWQVDEVIMKQLD